MTERHTARERAGASYNAHEIHQFLQRGIRRAVGVVEVADLARGVHDVDATLRHSHRSVRHHVCGAVPEPSIEWVLPADVSINGSITKCGRVCVTARTAIAAAAAGATAATAARVAAPAKVVAAAAAAAALTWWRSSRASLSTL